MERSFFERVWGEQEGWAIIARVQHRDDRDDEYHQRTYRYPDNLDLLIEDLQSWNVWASVYFGPLIFPEGKRDKNLVGEVPLVWVDKDSGGTEELDPRPTICWQTSKGKYQAFWLLRESVSARDAEHLNRYLCHKTNSDPGSRDLVHMLRVPGSLNHKYDPVQEGVLLWENGPTYDAEDLAPGDADLEDLKEERVSEAEVPDLPEDLPYYHEVITRWGSSIPSGVWELLNRRPEPEDDRSRYLWKIERMLLEAKIPVEDVYVIVRESTWNKYRQDKRDDHELWEEVWKSFYKDADPGQESRGSKFNWLSFSELLAVEYRPEWMVEGIWIDEAVGWIAGVGKSYKSVIALDLALSISSGEPFLGEYEVNRPGPVIMVMEEDPDWRVSHRIEGMALQKGLIDIKREGDMFLLPQQPDLPLVVSTGAGFTFNDSDFIEELEQMLYEVRPRILILDPWFMMTGGIDEFKSGEVVEVLRLLKLWREKYHCSICVVHHYRKGKGSPHELLYGSHAFYGWSENNMFISRDKTGNLVNVVRDVKDASQEEVPPFMVRFRSIGDVYDISMRDSTGDAGMDKILACLRTLEIGAGMTKDDLTETTELNEKTVRLRLKELHEQDKIVLERRGQGGKLVAVTQPALYTPEGVDLSDLLND